MRAVYSQDGVPSSSPGSPTSPIRLISEVATSGVDGKLDPFVNLALLCQHLICVGHHYWLPVQSETSTVCDFRTCSCAVFIHEAKSFGTLPEGLQLKDFPVGNDAA